MADKTIPELDPAVAVAGTDLLAVDNGATQKATVAQVNALAVADAATYSDAGDAATLASAEAYTDAHVPASRLTPLDAHHIHAWDLADATGDFVDTGSSASKVNLTATGASIRYATSGLFGPCVEFGVDPTTGAANNTSVDGGGQALVSAFSDLPTGSFTLELWYRSYITNLQWLFGVAQVGTLTVDLDGANAGPQGLFYVSKFTAGSNAQGAISSAYQPAPPFVWQYAALVWDSSVHELYVYLNGTRVKKATGIGIGGAPAWSAGTTPKMMVGADFLNGAGAFVGQMSCARLSDIARSEAEFDVNYKRAMAY